MPGRCLPALLLAIMTSLLPACGGSDDAPEAALRAWVERAETAAEAKDRPALTDMISSAYADARDNDREALDRLFRLYFLRTRSVALLTDIENIAVSGGSAATMTVTAGMAGTTGGTFGLNADAYRFELELESDGDEWLLIGARWGELGEELR